MNLECMSCGGTGLYRGFAEPKGTAVVCLYCKGTGCADIGRTPFIKRKERTDVDTVSRSRGTFILSCGSVGRNISYERFKNGEMP